MPLLIDHPHDAFFDDWSTLPAAQGLLRRERRCRWKMEAKALLRETALSVDEIAERIGASKWRLRELVKALGLTDRIPKPPARYPEPVRAQARALLEDTSRSLEEIAERTGLGDSPLRDWARRWGISLRGRVTRSQLLATTKELQERQRCCELALSNPMVSIRELAEHVGVEPAVLTHRLNRAGVAHLRMVPVEKSQRPRRPRVPVRRRRSPRWLTNVPWESDG